MTSMRVAIYARVSSDQQVEGGTVASQLAALQARLAQDGARLDPACRFVDEGYSGATLVRPGLERLRDLVATGTLDRVYVYAPDRLARRYAYQVLCSTSSAVAVPRSCSSIARSACRRDYMLLQSRVRWPSTSGPRSSSVSVAASATPHAAARSACCRLRPTATATSTSGMVAVSPATRSSRTRRRWSGRCSSGSASTASASARSAAACAGRPPHTRQVACSAVPCARAQNPAYAGRAAFGKTQAGPLRPRLQPTRGSCGQPRRGAAGYAVDPTECIDVPVPAVVDPVLFAAVQEQLAENRRRSRQRLGGEQYLLQCLVVCRRCGYGCHERPGRSHSATSKPRGYAYYRCSRSDRHRFLGNGCATTLKSVRSPPGDRLERVERLLRDPFRIAAEHERRLRRGGESGLEAQNLAAVEAQLQRLRRDRPADRQLC